MPYDYCSIAYMYGRDHADREFGRVPPPTIDMDHYADEIAVTQMVLEIDLQNKLCSRCPHDCKKEGP